jgi:hypothetical protein
MIYSLEIYIFNNKIMDQELAFDSVKVRKLAFD